MYGNERVLVLICKLLNKWSQQLLCDNMIGNISHKKPLQSKLGVKYHLGYEK